MKKLLTIFLLLIISMQILPTVELCKYFNDKEFVEDDYCEDAEKEKKFETEFLYQAEYSYTLQSIKQSQNHFPIAATGLQPHPIEDVNTPPPNVA